MTFELALGALKTVSNDCYILRTVNPLLKFRIKGGLFERKIGNGEWMPYIQSFTVEEVLADDWDFYNEL
jgi:hypothetical protein